MAAGRVLARGDFYDVERKGHGSAVYELPNGTRALRFEDFDISLSTVMPAVGRAQHPRGVHRLPIATGWPYVDGEGAGKGPITLLRRCLVAAVYSGHTRAHLLDAPWGEFSLDEDDVVVAGEKGRVDHASQNNDRGGDDDRLPGGRCQPPPQGLG